MKPIQSETKHNFVGCNILTSILTGTKNENSTQITDPV
jgi:hypothetical protein